ncbi:MAG TPA: phosphoribosyltransferase family protein, partial [Acetobacteraceae bacterium]
MATHYLAVSWDEFHRDAKALAERLVPAGPWRGIVAISRGGLVPATIIARALNIRVVETVSVVAYDQFSQGEEAIGEPKVTKLPDFAGDGEGFLIIDDLVDTGTTARVVR